MNDTRVREICKQRLGLWTDDLVGDHATPVLLLGIGHDDKKGNISICTVEEMERDKLIKFVAHALDRLLEGQ